MRPPKDLPIELVLLAESFCRHAEIDPSDWWDYVYGRKPWPLPIRAALVDVFAPLLPPLTSEHEPNTLDDVQPAISSNALRSLGNLADDVRNHKFIKAITKRGVTLAEVADVLTKRLKRKVPRSTVQSWPKPKTDPSYRAIPQDAADALKELYGVPESAWPRIIPR